MDMRDRNTNMYGTRTGMQEEFETTEDVMGEAKHTARDVAHQAQEQAKSALASQKGRAVEGLDNVAQALWQTGQTLREQDQEAIAHYTEKMAEQMETFTSQLRDKSVEQIVGDVENFARQRPEIFLGGAFALGFLFARFLKSSAPPHSRTYSTPPYGTGQWGEQPYGQPPYGRTQESYSEETIRPTTYPT